MPVMERNHSRSERFRPMDRLRLRLDFARVYAHRQRAADKWLAVYVCPNGKEHSRLGISVGKRIGNAVTRNYVRRRIREAFRTRKQQLEPGYDIVCVPRTGAADSKCDIAASLVRLVAQAVHRGRYRKKPTPG